MLLTAVSKVGSTLSISSLSCTVSASRVVTRVVSAALSNSCNAMISVDIVLS